MGGFGSGLYGSGAKLAKATTEECRSIDIRRFQRDNLLNYTYFGWTWRDQTGAETGNISVMPKQDSLMLSYKADGEPITIHVPYDETKTGFGTRKWFCCPTCDRRCAVLYVKGKLFACRQCQNLNYRSSQLSGDMGYYHQQLKKLCKILKAEYDPTSYFPPWKPKWMKWSKYHKLAQRYKELADKRDQLYLTRSRAILKRFKKPF